jgi:hypothetical protein
MRRGVPAMLLITLSLALWPYTAGAREWSKSSLRGRCIWHATGLPTTSGQRNGKGPFTIIAAVTFDGKGSLSMDYHANVDGAYGDIPNLGGVYSVDPDGHGTLTYTGPLSGVTATYDFYVTPRGRELLLIYRSNTTAPITDRIAWGRCQFQD